MSGQPRAVWPNLVALAAMVVFWAVLDIVLIRAWWQGYALLKRGVRTQAVVTHVWGQSERGHAFSYKFEVNGRSYEYEADTKTNARRYRSLAEGEQIEVVYLEENPRVAAVRSGISALAVWIWGAGLVLFSCLVWGVFVWLVWPPRRSQG